MLIFALLSPAITTTFHLGHLPIYLTMHQSKSLALMPSRVQADLTLKKISCEAESGEESPSVMNHAIMCFIQLQNKGNKSVQLLIHRLAF